VSDLAGRIAPPRTLSSMGHVCFEYVTCDKSVKCMSFVPVLTDSF
jgi:hypothetical protein